MSEQFDAIVTARKEQERDVLLSKHRDYGPKNIADSPGGALNGLRVRLHDKLARVNNLLDSGADPQHEGLIDTALDIANYGTIMALVLAGDWPGADAEESKQTGDNLEGVAARMLADLNPRELGLGVRVRGINPGYLYGEVGTIVERRSGGFEWHVKLDSNGQIFGFHANELEAIA